MSEPGIYQQALDKLDGEIAALKSLRDAQNKIIEHLDSQKENAQRHYGSLSDELTAKLELRRRLETAAMAESENLGHAAKK